MSKTAAGLVAFAKSKLGTPYIYGAKGTVMSLSQIRALRKQYGSNCVWTSDDSKAGKVCVDCSGLISWYTGTIRGSGQYKSTAVEVIPISKRTNAHIGWAVWMNGHIGIYLGDDKYIAADGSANGVRIANLSQNRFTHLLKLCDIDYGQGTVTPVKEKVKSSGGHYNVPVNFTYAVRTEDGKIYPFVRNLQDFAGVRGKRIVDIAIGCDVGSVSYRAHVMEDKKRSIKGRWLPYVTGCNWKDRDNGYAGNGQVIDAVEVIYYAPDGSLQKAQYRVSPLNSGYYEWQYNNETTHGQDGYAGCFGKSIDRFQLF
nr:MAG TPA: resuscitation promoting factor interacting protein [Caudoviricetes sp.]